MPVAAARALVREFDRMAEKNRGAELPQRVPGAVRAGPVSPVSLALPEELRQRMHAAVIAELAESAADEQERASEDRTTDLPGHKRPSESVARDHVTKWLGSTVKPQPAVRVEPVVRAPTATEPEAEVWPGLGKPRRRVGGRLIALVLAVIVIGSLAVAATVHRSPSSAAVRGQAAVWVAGQVSRDVTVSCDPVMCAALQAQGFPASKLVVLGPASPDPVPSVVVVETAAVRELFGSALATAWAPAVLASFGSGVGAVTVRVVAPAGAAAYQAALAADLASRQAAAGALLRASQVAVSAAARSQLLAGQVDSRLVLALVSVAEHEPVDVVRFGSLGPGASAGVPLGFADLAESIPATHLDTAAYARAVWAVLNGTDAQIRPERAISGPVQGQAILRVEFSSPAPLGNPSPGSP
jgi:hypothetical protein